MASSLPVQYVETRRTRQVDADDAFVPDVKQDEPPQRLRFSLVTSSQISSSKAEHALHDPLDDAFILPEGNALSLAIAEANAVDHRARLRRDMTHVAIALSASLFLASMALAAFAGAVHRLPEIDRQIAAQERG